MTTEPPCLTHETDPRFERLVNAVMDYAIYMLDPEGNVATWNPGARRFKGYEADEIIGKNFARFFTEEERAAGKPALALATARDKGRFECEGWRVRKDGTRFWAHVVIDPIWNEDGSNAGFAKIIRDITDRRAAQQELEEARAALFKSQKLQAIGELTGGIAHDFNNLMTVIRGSAELLMRPDVSAEKQARYLRAILDTADRASVLTNHLLAFGRRQALRPEVLDINVRLDAFAEMLPQTLGSSIEIDLDLTPDLPPIEVDLAQLETALLSAAINAQDAMPEGGRLTLSTSAQCGMVCIAMRDTGIGMTPEVLDRAFEPFFTTKPIGHGTGLGLSQIHGFAAQTGGRAEIESQAGEGTTIRLLLPAASGGRAAAVQDSNKSELTRSLSVLLVEDNAQVRAFAEQLLQELHCSVRSASDADKALDLLGRYPFDIVFSDVVMPGTSGIELARRVRERLPHMPILLASGFSKDLLHGAGSEFDVVRKPYGIDTLARGIVRALDYDGAGGSNTDATAD